LMKFTTWRLCRYYEGFFSQAQDAAQIAIFFLCFERSPAALCVF